MRLLALAGLLLVGAVWAITSRAGAVGDGPLSAQPMLGSADPATVMMGAAGTDIWAYRVLPREAGPPAGIAYGPRRRCAARVPALHGRDRLAGRRDAAGRDGAVERGPTPNRNSPRITPGGGGLLVGRGANGVSVLVRAPGGRFHEAPAIPDGLLNPAADADADGHADRDADAHRDGDAAPAPEAIAADSGAGRVADAAYEDGGALQAFFGVLGADSEDAVLHYDDGAAHVDARGDRRQRPVHDPGDRRVRHRRLAARQPTGARCCSSSATARAGSRAR